MGKRQRHSEFIGLSAAEVQAIIDDSKTPTDLRVKAIAEMKFRRLRNLQRRKK